MIIIVLVMVVIAYIDLSYIYSVIISLTYVYFSKRILGIKLNCIECISIIFLNIILYFNVFILPEFKFINIIFIFIYFFITYRGKTFKCFVLYLLVYYGAISYGLILDSNIYIHNFVVLLNSEISFFYVITGFINIVVIEIILFSIKSIKLLSNYKMNVEVEIDGEIYKVNAYMDSGNTLIKEDLPVIFLNDYYLEKKANEVMEISGVGVRKCKYKRAKVFINNNYINVICALVNDMNFKGCNCLLNIHLLKEI